MAHLSCLIVLRRLHQLFSRIHDERAIAGNRFLDRLSTEDQQRRVLFGVEHYARAGLSEQGQFSLLSPV